MRGFSTKSLRDLIVKGLRNYEEAAEGESGLVVCFNLVPSEKGLSLYDPLISLNADSVSWSDSAVLPAVDYDLSGELVFWLTDDVEFAIWR